MACIDRIDYALPTQMLGCFAATVVSFRVATPDLVLRFIGLVQQPHPIVICHAPSIRAVVAAGRRGSAEAIEGRDRTGAELLESLDRVLNTRHLLAWSSSTITGARSLTDRERDVLALIVAGHSNKETALELGIRLGQSKSTAPESWRSWVPGTSHT